MPLYRYRCDFCGHTYRELEFRSKNGEPVKICPNCGKKGIKKVISRVGVVYNAKGFHSTDYSSKKGKVGKREKPKNSSDLTSDSKDDS